MTDREVTDPPRDDADRTHEDGRPGSRADQAETTAAQHEEDVPTYSDTAVTEPDGRTETHAADEADPSPADREHGYSDTTMAEPEDRTETHAADETDPSPADREHGYGETAVAEPEDRTDAATARDGETPSAVRDETPSTNGEATIAEPEDRAAEEATPMAAEGGETSGLPSTATEAPLQLFQPDAVERFRAEMLDIQAGFVDDPHDAVRHADQLVAEAIQALSATFNEHKSALEAQWQQESTVQTEDLRLALRRYRSLLNQLLSS